MTMRYDSRTGLPQLEDEDDVQRLDDDELEAELTIASIEPTRRARRYDLLFKELLSRRRGYGQHEGSETIA